jgi:hypothetical protein
LQLHASPSRTLHEQNLGSNLYKPRKLKRLQFVGELHLRREAVQI